MLACVYLKDLALVVAGGGDGSILLDRGHVVACGAAAASAGVAHGMSTSEALGLYPPAELLYSQEKALADALEKLLLLFERFSPSVELLNSECIVLDLGRLPDERRLAAIGEQLLFALTQAGYVGRIGLADSRFVATVAAQVAAPSTYACIPRAQARQFLAPQPIDWLPVAPEIRRRLDRLGIRTLGELAKLPTSALSAQFGSEGPRLVALASGDDEQPVNAMKFEEALTLGATFESAIEGGDELLRALQQHLQELFATLKTKGQLATRLHIAFDLEGATSLNLALRFASPLSEAARVMGPLRQRLEALELQHPISGFTLTLEGLVVEYARQLTLGALLPAGRRQQAIERVLERFKQREEPFCLMQVVWDSPQDPIPERRAHLQDRVLAERRRGLYLPQPLQVAADEAGVPRMVRRRSHWVAVDWLVESWEVVNDWWTARPLRRHYYRVTLKNGAILRLFRDGLNGRWYQQSR